MAPMEKLGAQLKNCFRRIISILWDVPLLYFYNMHLIGLMVSFEGAIRGMLYKHLIYFWSKNHTSWRDIYTVLYLHVV